MGGLVGSIFDLASGDPTKKEEGQLGDLGGYETTTGEGATTAANDYYGGILSGDPSKIAETLAPEIKAGQDQVEQTAKTNAEFGNRGGGTNASTQGAQSNERGNIISLIGQEQSTAAGAEAGLGTNLLSQATPNITGEASLATANQQRKSSDVGGIAQGAAEIASGFIDPAAASMPGLPSPGEIATTETPASALGPLTPQQIEPFSWGAPQETSDTLE